MDDEEMVRNVTAAMLRSLGHEVAEVASGQEAVTEYQAAKDSGRPFDVALLDLTIRGGMGGEETLQALRAIDPDVKAVVSSGYVDGDAVADYQSRGFKACLRKPYQLEMLNSVLGTLLKGP
jgi:CheY-like chemotaxis protein